MKFRSNWQIYSDSFITGVFPSVLKTAKVVSSIVQSPCYQILEKHLKNLCIRDCIPFLITKILSTTYSLDSDNNILHLTP